jgi:hypothetical protein
MPTSISVIRWPLTSWSFANGNQKHIYIGICVPRKEIKRLSTVISQCCCNLKKNTISIYMNVILYSRVCQQYILCYEWLWLHYLWQGLVSNRFIFELFWMQWTLELDLWKQRDDTSQKDEILESLIKILSMKLLASTLLLHSPNIWMINMCTRCFFKFKA